MSLDGPVGATPEPLSGVKLHRSGCRRRFHSEPDSVSALDGATIGAEPDLHDRSDETAHAAAVAERHDGAPAGAQRRSGARAEARQLSPAPDEQGSDAAAELHGHVAAVRDRNEHEPGIATAMNAKTAQVDAAHDPPGHDHPDADPKAQLHIDAITAQRACRQQHENTTATGLRPSRRPCADRQDRALAGTEQHACGQDLQPHLRRGLPADPSPRNVDCDPLSTIVPQLDPSRAWRGECQPSGGDRERDARTVGVRPLRRRGGHQHKRGDARECAAARHRATAVNVTVAV